MMVMMRSGVGGFVCPVLSGCVSDCVCVHYTGVVVVVHKLYHCGSCTAPFSHLYWTAGGTETRWMTLMTGPVDWSLQRAPHPNNRPRRSTPRTCVNGHRFGTVRTCPSPLRVPRLPKQNKSLITSIGTGFSTWPRVDRRLRPSSSTDRSGLECVTCIGSP